MINVLAALLWSKSITLEILGWYMAFLRRFRNGYAMIRALRGGPPCEVAVLWDGRRLVHPPSDGMVTVLLDLWVNRCFMKDDFYHPADGDLIVDVGAHVGLFTVVMARENPRCRIEAIEPSPENFGYLKTNHIGSVFG